MSNTGCSWLLSFVQRIRSRPSNDTDQSTQEPNVICEQPLSQELQMGNYLDLDQSPTFPRSRKQHFDDVELVEVNSSPKRFKGCDLPDIGNSSYLTSILHCLNHTDAFKDILKSTVSCTKPHSDSHKELHLSELLHKIFAIMEHDTEKQDKHLRDIIKKIKSKTWGNNIRATEQQDIILTLENILELINEEVSQILEIFFFGVQISVHCPTNPPDRAIHQSIFLMPLPLPLVNDTFTFTFDEYIKTCLERQSQAIKCEKCSTTLDTDHMHDLNAKLLSTPSVLILYTNCSTLKEKKDWIEDAYEPFQNQVKYEAYAYIEYKSADTFSKKNAFLKWNDQWYKGSHPTSDVELQWHGRKSLILFFRKQNDTGALSFLSNKNTFDASVEESPKIDAESQSNLEITTIHNETETVHSSNHLPVLVKTSEINNGSAENIGTNLCGLKNLGNTCYMNSALQCLVHTKPLREFVMSSFTIVQNPGIAKAFSDLVREMSLSQKKVVRPVHFKSFVEMLDPQFKGYSQQDAQELINVLINGLHEEFNQVTGEKPYVDMKVDETKYSSEEEIEAAWKELRELRDKSEIINLFHVQIKITLRCHNCSFVKTSYDSLFPLSLPLPKTESKLTLESCLSFFTEEKQLANLKNCKSCHHNSKHFRKADIRKLPPILMVYLKRFNFHKRGNRKINRHVAFSCKFPTELQEVYPTAHDEVDYQLYAVINHYGSLESGHYISYVKCDGGWYSFNDNLYQKISEKEVCTSNAYVLFYECTKKNLGNSYPTVEDAMINPAIVQKSPSCNVIKSAELLAVSSSSDQNHETSRKRTNSPSTSSVKIMKPTRCDLFMQEDETEPIVKRTRNSSTKMCDKNLSYQSPHMLRVHPTICGLVNFGNTCYMNSALQCLVHTKPLREFILGSNTADKVLAKEFFNLISEMWESKLDFCQPINIKKALGKIDSKFKGNSQQDAQELISILINDLHEEFNEIFGEKPAVRMKVDESKFNTEEEIAAAWKKLTEKRDKSEIINIFNGQIKTTLKCHNCSNMQKSYDLFFPLILPLPSRKSGLNLKDCLKLFTEDKPLSNSKKCKNCHQVSEHSRKVDIWTLPPILMVYLKRFVMSKRGKYEKVTTHVDYSFTFPVEKFCHTNNQFEYQLYAVINHWGSLEFGHYFSFIKSDGKWFECNDKVCKKITENEVMSSDAYVLFYERVEKKLYCAEGGIQLMQSDLKLTPNAEKKKMQLDVDDITPTLTITVDSINQNTDSEYSYRQSLSNVNAALQCLVHTESLRKFITSKSTDVLNKQLATAFFEFINVVWIPERNICEPKLAKSFIERDFKGYLQQDPQELICNFINSLHEEFNEVLSQSKCQSEEDKALASKHFFQQSEVIRLFYGQMRFVLKCLECQNTSISFKPLFPWIDPLVESTKEEDPKYERYCKICNRLTNFLKTCDIWEMPSTLVVCHDREGYNSRKTKDAKLELTFTLSKFCHRERIRVEYQLYAVIVQLPKTGNCFSYIKSNREWYEYNNIDLLCRKISKSDVSSLDSCVLFYQRSDCCEESFPEKARVVSYPATFEMSRINEFNSPEILCHKTEIVPTLSLTVKTTDHRSEKIKKVLTKDDTLQNLSALTSALRCLIHTTPLKIFIVNNRGLDKKLASFFCKLYNDKMSLSEIIISQPEYLKLAIEPYSQQDAQELISILISDLHEEFNEITGEKPYVDMKVDESKFSSEEEKAAACKKLTELRDKSEIANIFYGQVKTTLRCHNCSYVQISYNLLFPLSLPLPKNESKLTLQSCLRLFSKEKQLSNSKKCKSCRKDCRHYRKIDIWKLPPILMVYLKRFNFYKSGTKKIEKPVEFRCKFPIQEFYPNAQDGIQYKLYAVINHHGSVESGYYFSYIKCDEQWYSFDDSSYGSYEKISEEKVCTSDAYVLFYEYSEQKNLQIDNNKPEEVIVNATPLPKSSSLEMLPKSSNRRNSGRPVSCSEEVLAVVPSAPDLTSRKRTITQSTSSIKMSKPTISDLHVVEVDQTNRCRNMMTETESDQHLLKIRLKQRVHPNICGLVNFGNTCYMNSALQCLVHTKPLREFIIKCSTIMDKVLAKAFFNLIREMWVSKLDFCKPDTIKTALEQTCSQVIDQLQQDAQEFINLLINGLRKEFNGEKALALKESEEQTKQSEIVNIFYGLIKTTFKCENCSKIQKSYEYLFPLKLTLVETKQSLTLEDCLRQFAIEKLSKNQIECSTCQNDALLSKVIELPPILVVCLDRFHNSGKKIRVSVKFGLTFPLEELCHREKQKTKYQLYAVINHVGSLSSGHYYSYVKCQEEWYECKDKRCNKISEEDIITPTSFPYILFFKRVELDK